MKRYNAMYSITMEESLEGDYVLYSDHRAEVARIKETVAEKDATIARLDVDLVEMRDEMDKKDVTIARLQDELNELRNPKRLCMLDIMGGLDE